MKFLITALTIISMNTFASEADLGEKIMNPQMCEGLELTNKQKVTIKKMIRATRIEIKKLLPSVKEARSNKRAVMLDASATKEEAQDAIREVRRAVKPIRKLRKKTRLAIDFDILSGDQRVKLVQCRIERRQERRGRVGRRGGLRAKLEAVMPGIMPILPN